VAHSFHNLLMHVIFSTHKREALIDAELGARLFPYMGGITRELDGCALAINGVADHVHCLVKLPATISVADFVGKLKANSSRWVNETFARRGRFSWQTGYAAFSVSKSAVDDVSNYIARQEEHHRRQSYEEEYLAFIQRHGLECDRRYVFE
jgi:REP-associated tyrosine transposase